jgi:hypothetical protein
VIFLGDQIVEGAGLFQLCAFCVQFRNADRREAESVKDMRLSVPDLPRRWATIHRSLPSDQPSQVIAGRTYVILWSGGLINVYQKDEAA